MFKKVAVLVSLIALSVPVLFGEHIIEFDFDKEPVIAYVPDTPEGSPDDCAGYPIPEEKPEPCETEERNLSYVSDFEAPGNVDPEPVIEYPEDKIWGSGKTAYPALPMTCPLPCGGDPVL